MEVHSIVILGAGFSGLGTAHYLLRHTIPALDAKDLNKTTTYKITIVTPSTHFFFRIASPRALLGNDDLLPVDKCFVPVEDGFKGYDKDKLTFVYGAATQVDGPRNRVTVHKSDGSEETLGYKTLVLAAGSKSSTPIWSLFGGHEQSIQALKEMAVLLKNAKSGIIAGGGAAGVETAGMQYLVYTKLGLAEDG